jgi:hypothetical protein
MQRRTVSLLVIALLLAAAHGRAAEDQPRPLLTPEFTGGGSPSVPTGHPPLPVQPQGELVTGRVLETMDAGKYTYVRVKAASEELWAAGLKTAVKVGDTVTFSKGMEMRSFHSETLKRTFDSIYFVDELKVGSAGAAKQPSRPGAAAAAAHGAATDGNTASPHGAAAGGKATNPHGAVSSGAAGDVDVTGIEPAEGGQTVKELREQRSSLAGQDVAVRGKVVKANPGVMGKNWYHLRDGTTAGDGGNDITITSADIASVGDTVVVRGKLVTDKDFGFGYRYDVMIEDATVTRE